MTRWSLVSNVSCDDPEAKGRALEELCRDYWKPVYAYARRLGHSPSDSEDLAQGFFSMLLSRGDFDRIDKEKGKFRTFIRTAFRHYVSDFHRAAGRIKRGGGAVIFSFDSDAGERRYLEVSAAALSPEQVFDRHFAIELLGRAMGRLQEAYEEGGKQKEFAALKLFLDTDNQPTYADAAETLEMSVGTVKSLVYRFRGHYRAMVLQEAKDILGPGVDTDAELRDLFRAFS